MRIFNLCDNLSISVVKQVQLQKMLGHQTATCYRRCGLPKFAIPRVGFAVQPASVQAVDVFCQQTDLVMVHTSINSTKMLGINTHGKPLVWACHDYVVKAHDDYRDMINACIVPSHGYKAALKDEPFPTVIIHRKLASKDWPEWRHDRINATIMAGVVSDNPKQPYRDYSFAADALKGRLMVQSAQLPSMMAEKYLIMETVDPSTMLNRLAMFDTSWCGCGTDSTNFDTIQNNMFHESIASGAVPILYRSREMSEYADQYKCGITWNGEYPATDQLYECRRQIWKDRALHSLEFEGPVLRALLSRF